jgi:hypothetical protein
MTTPHATHEQGTGHRAAAGGEVPGLAELAQALRRSAALPGVLILLDSDLGAGAEALSERCTSVPRVHLGRELADDADSAQLAGVVAHEIAHHALGHLTHGAGSRALVWLVWAAVAVAVVAHLPVVVVCVVAGCALAARVALAARRRRQEYDADAYSIHLLDGAGLDGQAIVTATLAHVPAEDAWYRTIGWLFGSHPTARARRRCLTRRRPALHLPRLMWRRAR